MKTKPCWPLLGLLLAGCGQPTTTGSALTAQAGTGLCAEYATVNVGPYTYQNNTWGSGKAQGSWSQCLQQRSVNAQTQTGWSWNWPGHDPSVFAYPEILFGWSPWGGGTSSDARFPMQVAGIPNVYMDYDVDHTATGSWDLAPEVWLTKSGRTSTAANPGDIATEVMFWLDYNAGAQPAGSKVADVTIDGKSYALYKANISNGQASWTYLTYLGPTGQFKGRLNIDKFLRDAVARGYTSANNYLSSIEFGDESSGGTGSTWVKSYAVGVGSTTSPSGSLPGGFHQLINRSSGKCVDVEGGPSAVQNGRAVQQWDCGGNSPTNQQFSFTPTDSGYYRITAQHSGRVVEVAGGQGATASGSRLDQWDAWGGTSQQWKAVDVGGGYYKFLARNSGRALDVPGCRADNGLQLQVWDDLNNDCQKFKVQ